MNKKTTILSIVSLLVFSLIFGYSLVFAGSLKIDSAFVLSHNIFTDSAYLNNTTFVLKSGSDLSKQKITANCNFYSKMPEKKDNYYMYNIKFLDNSCKWKIFQVSTIDEQEKYLFSLNFLTEFDILEKVLDRPSSDIEKMKKTLENKIDNLKTSLGKENSYYEKVKKQRMLQELNNSYFLMSRVLDKRKEKYIVPVAGKKLPTTPHKVPNTGRPYRSEYTDWVHHWWDIDGYYWEQVLSLDDGIIIRVVDEFDKQDFDKLVYGNNLTEEQELWNLDVLRGNQVWLKTMKWDVVFYSHLSNIFDNITPWSVVTKWQPIWEIGTSGVPGEGYNDYHLHFPVHKNPYNKPMGYKYSFEEYMKLDWYFKGESIDYVLSHQWEVFENE